MVNKKIHELVLSVFYNKDAKTVKEIKNFFVKNNSLTEKDFIDKFNQTYPLLDEYIKYRNSKNINTIANCIIFFTVIYIISIIAVFITVFSML